MNSNEFETEAFNLMSTLMQDKIPNLSVEPDGKLHQVINRESISDYPFAGQQPVTLPEEKEKEVSPRFRKIVRIGRYI